MKISSHHFGFLSSICCVRMEEEEEVWMRRSSVQLCSEFWENQQSSRVTCSGVPEDLGQRHARKVSPARGWGRAQSLFPLCSRVRVL